MNLFKPVTIDEEFPLDYSMIINISGGKDSQSMAYYLATRYAAHQKVLLYNDTGFEHEGILAHIEQIAVDLALPLVVLKPQKDLFGHIRDRQNVPSDLCRFCTGALKIEPAQKWIRANFPTGKVVVCSGLRGEESRSRAKLPPIRKYDALCTKKREVLRFNPLLYWKEAHVFEYLEGLGVRPFHTYEYLSRLSCRFCFLSGKRDRDAIRMNDPEGFSMVQELTDSLPVDVRL